MPASPRSTVTLPLVRIEQLRAIAAVRGLASPAALVEQWIERAIAEHEIPNAMPGYYCTRVGGRIVVSVANVALPAMTPQKARMFAAILSAASGDTDPELDFEMPIGAPIVLDVGEAKVAIGRAGHLGVRIVVRPLDGSDNYQIPAPNEFIASLADLIRDVIAGD